MSNKTGKDKEKGEDEMLYANKITASIGTYVVVSYPELTSWLLSGWSVVEEVTTPALGVLIRKVRE